MKDITDIEFDVNGYIKNNTIFLTDIDNSRVLKVLFKENFEDVEINLYLKQNENLFKIKGELEEGHYYFKLPNLTSGIVQLQFEVVKDENILASNKFKISVLKSIVADTFDNEGINVKELLKKLTEINLEKVRDEIFEEMKKIENYDFKKFVLKEELVEKVRMLEENLNNTREKGERGEQGIQGEKGNDGASITVISSDKIDGVTTVRLSDGTTLKINDGLQGTKGDKGETGAPGIQGLKGEQGEQGIPGSNGENGKSLEFEWQGTRLGVRLQGESEFNYVDLKGEIGERGIQGVPGQKGETGERGLPGIKGDIGEQGAPGERGLQGEQGKSAYQIWLDLGNNGTEQDFINSLSRVIIGEGRPDILTTTNGKITGNELNGTEYISTDGAGVGAFKWIKRNNQWVVTEGDTGWLKITTNLFERGFIKMKRRGNICYVTLGGGRYDTVTLGTKYRTGVGKLVLGDVPRGFRTAAAAIGLATEDGNNAIGGFVITSITDGSKYMLKGLSADKFDLIRTTMLIYITDDIYPTELPGVRI